MKQSGIPLYLQIEDYIAQKIYNNEFRPGDRLPSEHELSDILNVSRLTVRKAYTNLIEKGVLYSVQGKGTFIASNSNVKGILSETVPDRKPVSSNTIGVIFPEITMFFSSILKEIEESASKCGYSLNIMFNDSIERENHAINSMISNKVNGIIISPLRINGKRSLETLYNSGMPTVMVGKPPLGINFDCVMCDDVAATYSAVSYFAKNGHTNILRLFDSRDDEEALIERSEGYLRAMRELLPTQNPRTLDCTSQGWQSELASVLTGPDCATAVFADGDTLAIQAHVCAANLGIEIPNKLEIIGYNNINLHLQFGIDMSTIEIPKIEMGKRAFEMLKEKIEVSTPATSYSSSSIFYPKVTHRSSTKQIQAL